MGYGDAVENTSLELPEGARVEKFSANASFRASVYDFLLEMPCDVIDEFAEANQLRRPVVSSAWSTTFTRQSGVVAGCGIRGH